MSVNLDWQNHGNVAVAAFAPAAGIADLDAAIRRAEAEPGLDAIVVAGLGSGCFRGLSDEDFADPEKEICLADRIMRLRELSVPIIAVIDGDVFDAGLQIALACDVRIAASHARLSLTRFKIGLIPGALGTQMLPRVVGSELALDMIISGKVLSASDALGAGLVDKVAWGDLSSLALEVAQDTRKAASGVEITGSKRMTDADFERYATKHKRKVRAQEAFPAAIAAVRAAQELSVRDGARLERELFETLRNGPQFAALKYAEQSERVTSRIPLPKGTRPRMVRWVGVIGAGTMGTGIATALLSGGYRVTLSDRDEAALMKSDKNIRQAIAKLTSSGRMDAECAAQAMSDFETSLDLQSLSSVDLIIEAAFETMEVKRKIFADLDRIARHDAVLATNTSYLNVEAIAGVTSRPANVVGMHFFSPAHIMKLLEVVRTAQTCPDAIATAFDVGERIGKRPVLAGNSFGFIGNRMLALRRLHAEDMAIQGADIARIDFLMEDFGFPMGPFRISDLAGLDLGWSAESSTGATIRERLCEAGRRGQKTGAGFYTYDDAMEPLPSSETRKIVRGFARDRGIAQRQFCDAEILDRLLWPMVDEGAKLLAEGVALRESDIDVVWRLGYGWPAWTGGPMFHARRTGLSAVCRRLEALGFPPSSALKELAEQPAPEVGL